VRLLILSVCIGVMMLGCAAPQPGPKPESAAPAASSGMVLTSTAFKEGEMIPLKYSGYGENVSPDLAWDKIPEGTRCFALICRDPDAPGGTFYHWVLFNIPDTVRPLPEGIGREPVLPFGGAQGVNSFLRVGYDGPRPPMGTHRYYFDLYALDVALTPDQAATADKLLEMMKGHILAKASLMGKYSR